MTLELIVLAILLHAKNWHLFVEMVLKMGANNATVASLQIQFLVILQHVLHFVGMELLILD